VAETALDDVFIDDITFPAVDGSLLGATLFLPRGARRDPDQFRHRRAAQESTRVAHPSQTFATEG
jgi:hypothetical protein